MGKLFDTHQYWNDRLQKNWGLQGVGDISKGKGFNHWLYRFQKVIFSRVLRRLPLDLSKASVLDIGPGVGFYIDLWEKAGARSVTGVDISDFAVEKLKERFPANPFVAEDIGEERALETLQSYAPFDIISAFAVLYHIVDAEKYQKAFENMRRLLKPGGYLVFTENLLHGREATSSYQVSRSKEAIEAILNANHFHVTWIAPEFVFMASPIDSTHPLSRLYWKAIHFLTTLGEAAGYLVGAVLYPFEILATRIKKDSQSTEILICKLEE